LILQLKAVSCDLLVHDQSRMHPLRNSQKPSHDDNMPSLRINSTQTLPRVRRTSPRKPRRRCSRPATRRSLSWRVGTARGTWRTAPTGASGSAATGRTGRPATSSGGRHRIDPNRRSDGAPATMPCTPQDSVFGTHGLLLVPGRGTAPAFLTRPGVIGRTRSGVRLLAGSQRRAARAQGVSLAGRLGQRLASWPPGSTRGPAVRPSRRQGLSGKSSGQGAPCDTQDTGSWYTGTSKLQLWNPFVHYKINKKDS
jgi:hypothetical protein